MNTKELLQQVKYLVDADGNKTAVLVNIELWEKLQLFLKSMAAHEQVQQFLVKKDEMISWEEFLIELEARDFPTTYNTPEDFIQAIQKDFSCGGLYIARWLAFRGVEVYPNHELLQKYARILAPPEVKVSPSSPEKRQRTLADQEWMKKNRLKYRGRWVAVRNGELLADTASVDELIAKVGDLKGIFFTRVI